MLKRFIATATAAAVFGIGGIAVANAATGPKAKLSAQSGGARQHGAGTGRHFLKAAAQVAADTIGIDVATLRTEVKAKGTIAAVATAHGVTPQSVIDALVAKANTNIDEAVANGKLSADRATKLKSRVPTIAAKFVNDTSNVVKQRASRGAKRADRRGEAIGVAADAIGISADALKTELKAGKSVAEVAAAHNVDTKTVVDAIVANATTRIDAAVTAGKIDATRAASLKDRLPTMITRLVNHHRMH